MRNDDGIWCDHSDSHGRRCGRKATHIIACQIELSEFAQCEQHKKEWVGKTRGKPDQEMRCPRCLPGYLARTRPVYPTDSNLPDPSTGPLADAFANAMHMEGILRPTITRVLRRLANTQDPYVQGILRSTAIVDNYEEARN